MLQGYVHIYVWGGIATNVGQEAWESTSPWLRRRVGKLDAAGNVNSSLFRWAAVAL
jgi:hypothetical protein